MHRLKHKLISRIEINLLDRFSMHSWIRGNDHELRGGWQIIIALELERSFVVYTIFEYRYCK